MHISGLNKSFGKQTVLNDISLEFSGGKVICLIGPNGSGKTTLIKCLLGLVIPDRGIVKMDTRDMLKDWTCRNAVGYMPQILRFPEQIRMKSVFELIKDFRSDFQNYDEELIESLGLNLIMQKKMGTLSGGTRQKVSAALAFLFRPSVLVLDEPTSGLDPVASEKLKNKIRKERQRGALTFITTHNMSEVEELADNVVFIVDGKIRFYKSVDTIMNETGEMKIGRGLAKLMEANGYA
ncbi:MAG: ABC transporter ATP-binding protein [Bacteroidetes bacterium]|nr:MAG: ABC transporter ATP-binding protein [Bacteroidota bacterium]